MYTTILIFVTIIIANTDGHRKLWFFQSPKPTQAELDRKYISFLIITTELD